MDRAFASGAPDDLGTEPPGILATVTGLSPACNLSAITGRIRWHMRVPAERTALTVSFDPHRRNDVHDRPLGEPPSGGRVARIRVWSAVKVSLVFYFVMGLMSVTAGVALSVVSKSTGSTVHLQHLAQTLFNIKSLPLGPPHVAAVTAATAGVVALVGTMVNLLAVLVYNSISNLVGGVDVNVRMAPATGPKAGASLR